mgnify:CR=1 FL=1
MDANKELMEALNQIEKEKDISKDILLEAIENSLLAACKNQLLPQTAFLQAPDASLTQ